MFKQVILFSTGTVFLLFGCNITGLTEDKGSSMTQKENKHNYTNNLIRESSPYLLQHAHNPVNWYAWGDEALEKAKKENKALLISIGYSACHWCHVMERESFEDVEVAEYMNEHFVCIKVDREERPDIDQIYMSAVQQLTGSGGWPLNCFALPDGRPFFGGTYFPKKNWLYLMKNVVSELDKNRTKVEEYAENLTNDIRKYELVELNENDINFRTVLNETISGWTKHFDITEGGPDRVPKFPLPNNYLFLLHYSYLEGNDKIAEHVEKTLDKMAMGGIYDQIGGGFSRYSTDRFWKVPHFEKMLYDNAQLIGLYSMAYQRFKKPLYKRVVLECISFVQNELTGPDGEFYSAIDADSEGEEGKYYVWDRESLEKIKDLDLTFAISYFVLEEKYSWEGKYIPHRIKNDDQIKKEFNFSDENLEKKVKETRNMMLAHRNKRIRPGTDDKSLTSWNALMISGLVQAHSVLPEKNYLKMAQLNAGLLWDKQFKDNGLLMHSYKKGKSTIPGFLEDYALLAQAYTDLYQADFNEIWLNRAETLVKYALENFFDPTSSMFYFTHKDQSGLVSRKMEINDNVLPSSNSVMANVLFQLGHLKDIPGWIKISTQMQRNVSPLTESYGSAYSNWAILMLTQIYPHFEIAVSGKDFGQLTLELKKEYLPNTLFIGCAGEGNLPLLKNKHVEGKTLIYVCVNKTCQLPTENSGTAIKQINQYR